MQANIPALGSVNLRMSDLLLVTASEEDAELWLDQLRKSGWEGRADVVTDPGEIYARCQRRPYQALLLDQSHPLLTSRLTAELLRRLAGHPPVILITDAPGEMGALEGLAYGAFDYVFRSCLGRLPVATQRAVETTDLRVDLEGADHQVQEAEHRFQALAEILSTGVAVEGKDGILHANAALANLLSASTSLELLGKNLADSFMEEAREPFREKLRQLESSGTSFQFEVLLHSEDGSPVEVTVTAALIGFRGQSARLYAVQSRRDQRRAEAAITNLAAFAQENPNPILMFASDGRLTYYNHAAVEMAHSFGREHPASCIPPQAPSIVESCLLTGQNRLRVIWTQGKRTFSWSFYPQRAGGVVHAFVIEITEQVTLEEQLRHSQRLEAVGRLASGVAHEFNNLMTVIQGQAKIVAQAAELTPKCREAMQQLFHAAETATQVTRQLQAFGRRNHVNPTVLDLNEVVHQFSDLLTRTLGDDVRLELELGASLPKISGDRALLEQVILNLAVNAREAMPEGGQLVLKTTVVDLQSKQTLSHPEARPGRFARLSVSDTGRGIEPAILPHLFEPLFTTKDPNSVVGLGLSTAYGIIKQHQGWIEVNSHPGNGSSFNIFLPVAPSWAVEDLESDTRSDWKPSEHTVLLVEDDTAVRWTLKSMLEQEGYPVFEAGSPLEALALWREKQDNIDALLTDLVMPTGISGQELAEHLLHAKPALKVIFTSGYTIDSIARGTPLEFGVNFLQKPFSARAFTLALQQQCVWNQP